MFCLADTRETSRGKLRYFQCVNAGFTEPNPTVDGGLRYHVLARPD
jgi:hypothetical protein